MLRTFINIVHMCIWHAFFELLFHTNTVFAYIRMRENVESVSIWKSVCHPTQHGVDCCYANQSDKTRSFKVRDKSNQKLYRQARNCIVKHFYRKAVKTKKKFFLVIAATYRWHFHCNIKRTSVADNWSFGAYYADRGKEKQANKPKMNLKIQILFCTLLVIVSCGEHVVRGDDKNITRLLNNQVIVSRQIMCVLEKSPCDQLGRQLKGK